jgi:hypothetical protein
MNASTPASAFWSWEDEEKQSVRSRLRKARDISARRAVAAESDGARRLFWEANALANRWCFAAASTEDLTEIANGIVRLFMAADTIERMEGANGN